MYKKLGKCPKCHKAIDRLITSEMVERVGDYINSEIEDEDVIAAITKEKPSKHYDGYYEGFSEDTEEYSSGFMKFSCPECQEELCEDSETANRILSGLTRLQEVVKDKIEDKKDG